MGGRHPLIEFLFILAIPLGAVAGGLITLFAVGAFFDATENPDALRARIEGAFRRTPKPPRTAGADHYYRPYWQGSSPDEPR